MRTQAYYENLKKMLYERLRYVLGKEGRIRWEIRRGYTIAILSRSGGGLSLTVNLRAVEFLGSVEALCSRVLPRIAAIRSAAMEMPDSYLQGLAWLEDLYSLEREGKTILSALPRQDGSRQNKKRMFTAADLYGASCAGELALLTRIPEICYCGKADPQSAMLRALDQLRWLLENGHVFPLVQFAADGDTLCSLPELLRRCIACADPFWCGMLFRLMTVSGCQIPLQQKEAGELLGQQSDLWRSTVLELWETGHGGADPILTDTLGIAEKMLKKLDKLWWSSPAGHGGGSLHLI